MVNLVAYRCTQRDEAGLFMMHAALPLPRIVYDSCCPSPSRRVSHRLPHPFSPSLPLQLLQMRKGDQGLTVNERYVLLFLEKYKVNGLHHMCSNLTIVCDVDDCNTAPSLYYIFNKLGG
ncbi:unnamed protein product [Chondrus crispus]|uniref:Uncharacterized protein n=1 Tax=Chondrus crispus TaxID=2769 RepID=R7QFE1_CHOCR|nr:unnamed protein product [Chondrus crispus]CDF36804.1 unnamed protein product [Chondrus crispus]|eukprot:XP_005716623.1 unnamed protein product [Chondrus crispus]